MQFYTTRGSFLPLHRGNIYVNKCHLSKIYLHLIKAVFAPAPLVQYLVLDPIRLGDHPVTWDRCSPGRIR